MHNITYWPQFWERFLKYCTCFPEEILDPTGFCFVAQIGLFLQPHAIILNETWTEFMVAAIILSYQTYQIPDENHILFF